MRRPAVVVLGQGIAGTLTSWRLRSAGVAHLVVDPGHRTAASRAAAGIVNPVTGRRFVLAWRAAEAIEGLAVYRELEAELGIPLLSPLSILRDLSETEAANRWDLRRGDPEYAPFLGPPTTQQIEGASVPHRVGPTAGFRVDLPALIRSYRRDLAERGELLAAECGIDWGGGVDCASAKLRLWRADGTWQLDGPGHQLPTRARFVVDCRGAGSMGGAWAELPWRGTKGEALRFARPGWPRSTAVKRRAFACPLGTGADLWLGGTNEDHFPDARPSQAGLAWLREQAGGLGLTIPEGAEHLSAIRPTTRTRRPFVSEHPSAPGLWICGGLGTKGASLAPLCSAELLDALVPTLRPRN